MENQIMTMEMVNDGQHITSLEIAKLVGKAHNHVMRDIRNMEPAWEKVHLSKFGQTQIRQEISNGGYRLRPCFGRYWVHFAVRPKDNRRKIDFLNA